MDTKVQNIVNSLTEINAPITQAQIPSIVVAALAASASLTNLSTTDREDVIIGVVDYYIIRSNMTPSEQTVIINLVPGIVDALTNLPQVESSVAKWFKTNCTGSNCCK